MTQWLKERKGTVYRKIDTFKIRFETHKEKSMLGIRR